MKSEWIGIDIKRPDEGYEGVHDDLVVADFIENPKADWVCRRRSNTPTDDGPAREPGVARPATHAEWSRMKIERDSWKVGHDSVQRDLHRSNQERDAYREAATALICLIEEIMSLERK